MRRSHPARYAARLALALTVGGLLVLGPSAALAQAPAAPLGPTTGTHGTSGMTGHLCPSMNNDWL
ncbi:hypothetical protein [Lapillicoccus sp.]|uniref:hypothetical protein n=1 Tax=Lapillicoccus sp. TaxID=1909287 RepID=UPI0025ED7C6D|nr:hypothetical protein [Lapillicoccus sp.]